MENNIRVNSILLLESDFRRISSVMFGEDVVSEVTIETEISNPNNNLINVLETVTVKQKCNEQEQVSIRVKMVGVFECDDIADYEEFGKIQGASIIFPYIREHLTSLSLKAGIPAIILPPVDFKNSVKNNA